MRQQLERHQSDQKLAGHNHLYMMMVSYLFSIYCYYDFFAIIQMLSFIKYKSRDSFRYYNDIEVIETM